MKLVTKLTPEQVVAKRLAYRMALAAALAELAAVHRDYPDIEDALVRKVLQTHGRGHGAYGVERLAGMVRNIGEAGRRPPLTVNEAAQVKRELFGPC